MPANFEVFRASESDADGAFRPRARSAKPSRIVGVICVACALVAGEADPAVGQSVDVVVDRAVDVVGRTNAFWTWIGFQSKRAQYTVGWSSAPAAGYVLLAGPAIGTVGLLEGPASASAVIASDAIVAIIERAAGAPRLAARSVATALRDQSLEEYRIAYDAAQLIKSGDRTRATALRFLRARWGVVRLEIAGNLYAASLESETAEERVASAATEAVLSRVVDDFQVSVMRGRTTVPVVEAGALLARVYSVLMDAEEGLGSFAAFRTFRERLDTVASQALAEARALGAEGEMELLRR